jgi:hypothetical protein
MIKKHFKKELNTRNQILNGMKLEINFGFSFGVYADLIIIKKGC